MGATREKWLPIRGWPAYEVSDRGRVRSYWRARGRGFNFIDKTQPPKIMKRGRHVYGYPTVRFYRNCGERASREIHALVARAFLGARPRGYDVRHLDGDPTNNRVSNLRYGTRTQNMADAKAYGQKLGRPVKWSNTLIAAIRVAAVKADLTQAQIASEFGVAQGLVSMIKNGKYRS